MTTDPLVFLRAALDAAQAEAEAARGGSAGVWSADVHPHYDGARIYDDQGDPVVFDGGSPSAEQAAHIARHDPAAVLRRIAGERKILALHEGEHQCSVYSHTGEISRCAYVFGGDVCSTTLILAEGWGWAPEG